MDCRIKRRAHKPVKEYATAIADFISYVGNIDVNDLTADNLREYVPSLRWKRRAMTYYSALKDWLAWCYMKGFTKETIVDLSNPPKFLNGLPSSLKAEEINALFEYIRTRPFRIYGRVLIRC
jgi:site-specific recombinase XerD